VDIPDVIEKERRVYRKNVLIYILPCPSLVAVDTAVPTVKMGFVQLIFVLAGLKIATALTTPAFNLDRSNDLFPRSNPIKMPAWNYANETTPDATPDGMVGVIIDPDLVEGKPGKDGGIVKKTRLGPYTVQPGAMLERPVPMFPAPCKDCYITAMQLGLEYADGKIANVDTGAWFVNLRGREILQSWAS
jgi:hypothetical protein